MSTETLSGSDYLRLVRLGAERLGVNRAIVNDLNVFPIPDGDTGDNMYMTIRSGCEAVSQADTVLVTNAADAVSRGMLLGARGNSGVILSRFFAGLAKGLSGLDSADLPQWKAAMDAAVAEAYGSVATPVEGTVLTVMKDGVRAASAYSGKDFEGWFDLFVPELRSSLERTPSLLDVLRNAGVVDSGGAGFVNIAEGMQAAVAGEQAGEFEDGPSSPSSKVDISAFTEDSELEFGYCTEFLLRLQNSKVDLDTFDESVIREYLESAGESLVFFRDGSIIKVHVHTFRPGDILNVCQKWGEYLTIKIENMTLQHHENRMEEKFQSGPRRRSAVVAVASGKGIVSLFSDMGADHIIEGGQTMNPSAEDFVNAFRKVNADTVYVLPNNSNIILTAEQAASMYDESDVCVLPVKTIGAGYAVLGSVDFHSWTRDEVERAAADAVSASVTGMISTAVRDTGDVRKGEFIGFMDSEILCASSERTETLRQFCALAGAGDYDVVLVIKGADVPLEEAETACNELGRLYPRTEFILNDGGQPIFDYITVFE